MGSDDLHKKRRERRAIAQKRVMLERKQRGRALVLCEGETEEFYVSVVSKSVRDKIVIDVSAQCPTCPLGMLKKAKEIVSQDEDYDRVFLIFDCDVVTPEKMSKVITMAKESEFTLIKSDPSFEYWLLVHFNYTRKPFTRLQDKSPSDQVISELKKINGMQGYAKAKSLNMSLLVNNIAEAVTNSKRSISDSQKDGASNPSTNMYVLIDYLNNPNGEEPL